MEVRCLPRNTFYHFEFSFASLGRQGTILNNFFSIFPAASLSKDFCKEGLQLQAMNFVEIVSFCTSILVAPAKLPTGVQNYVSDDSIFRVFFGLSTSQYVYELAKQSSQSNAFFDLPLLRPWGARNYCIPGMPFDHGMPEYP